MGLLRLSELELCVGQLEVSLALLGLEEPLELCVFDLGALEATAVHRLLEQLHCRGKVLVHRPSMVLALSLIATSRLPRQEALMACVDLLVFVEKRR